MAACGNLQHIFENPTLLESLYSWNQIKPVKPIEQSSFTEIFGELHFKENSESSPCLIPTPVSPFSSAFFIDLTQQTVNEKLSTKDGPAEKDSFSGSSTTKYACHHKSSNSFSSMSSDSLQLCTEGLGFESSDDVEDLRNEINEDWQNQEDKPSITTKHHVPSENQGGEFRRSRTSGGAFPPPISCISKSGKPWVCFKSYRQDGSFVLKEIRIPTQEFLHACREDGRLKLYFVQPNDEILEEEEEEEEEEEDGEEEEEESEEKDTEGDGKNGKENDDGESNGGEKEGNKAEVSTR